MIKTNYDPQEHKRIIEMLIKENPEHAKDKKYLLPPRIKIPGEEIPLEKSEKCVALESITKSCKEEDNGCFIEGVHSPKLREELPENLSGVFYIPLKEERASKVGVFCVDGYYQIDEKTKTSMRQIREYEADSFEDAAQKARVEGLVHGIMIEQILSDWVPCSLSNLSPNNIKR